MEEKGVDEDWRRRRRGRVSESGEKQQKVKSNNPTLKDGELHERKHKQTSKAPGQ